MRYVGCVGTEEERFWRKVQVNYETGCWEWTAGSRDGLYGGFVLATSPDRKFKCIGAHVWSYEYFNGPVPSGCEVHHKCENTKCVRPDHLEALVEQVHIAISGGCCAQYAMRLYCKRGHMVVGDNIRWTLASNGKRFRRCIQCDRIENRERAARYRTPEYKAAKAIRDRLKSKPKGQT